MKTKTICKIIRKKMESWWTSIHDTKLRDDVKANTIVTGGCIASLLLNEKPKDYDIYLKDEQVALRLAEYYVKQFKEFRKSKGLPDYDITVKHEQGRIRIHVPSKGVAGEEDDYEKETQDDPEKVREVMGEKETPREESNYRAVFFSSNAISLSKGIQVVLRFTGDASGIHENFDFVHCTNYWVLGGTDNGGLLYLSPDALESIITKELKYIGSKYPVCSIFRIRKFVARGWSINAGQILKILMQIQDLNLNDINVLEEQLTGVDVAYFHQLISRLRESATLNEVCRPYLLELINKLF